MPDKNKVYVLRLKDEKQGHIFYEYLEGASMLCEGRVSTCKMKYAIEFETYESALEEKKLVDKDDEFDIVNYTQAEEEYYNVP